MSPTVRARAARAVALVVVGALVLLGASACSKKSTDEPAFANFYAAPADVPAEPGQLIRSEPVTSQVPEGAQAWRILYTTTRDEGVPAVASALVVAGLDSGQAKKPVIAWAHGTTGIASDCAPSVRMDALTFGAIPGLSQAISKGWVVVATDYVGLGTVGPHPYLIGQGEGRSVLDSVRAAHQLTDVSLADHTVVWGHSQGGHAALWAGILAPTYAPDAYVDGIGAIAPASNVAALVDNLGTLAGGAVFNAYAIASYEAAYPKAKVEKYLRAAAREPIAQLADRCLADSSATTLSADPVFEKSYFTKKPSTGKFGEVMDENSPTATITVPIFIGQGAVDPLVLPSTQAAYVSERCADPENGPLDYVTYPGRGHVNVIAADSALPADLVAWTARILAGKKAPSTC